MWLTDLSVFPFSKVNQVSLRKGTFSSNARSYQYSSEKNFYKRKALAVLYLIPEP
jgi:hypothetical protein